MLTSLSLQNFKSWQEIREMRLSPITGFFGTNSSGKTSILQMLLLLKQTADSSDRSQVLAFGDDRSLVSLGSYQELIYRHDTGRKLSWKIDWRLPSELRIPDPAGRQGALLSGNELAFSASVANGEKARLVVRELAYEFGGHEFGMIRRADGKYDLLARGGDFEFKRPQGRPWKLPDPVRCYGFPDQVRAYYQNAGFLSDFELAFEQMLERVYYLGPLREDPRRVYAWAGDQPADMGPRGEHAIDALLASRESGQQISRGSGRGRKAVTLEEMVATWLRELGMIHDFSVDRITEGGNLYQVRVRRSPEAAPVLITDIGFGVSQILPVLVLCYYAPEGSTIILEQPEIHLHPSVQSRLADVFIDVIKLRKIQILLESHSEHLLLRLQRRIVERYRVTGQSEAFTEKDAALYFCDINQGESRLQPLDLDEYGNIRNWPEDFFGDQFGESARMMDAAMERKKLAAA